MAFDFKKVIEFLNPTYAQLKGLLIASVGTIGMVWFISSKTTTFQAQTKETNELVKQTVEDVRTIKEDMATKTDITNLHTEMIDLNTRNNAYLNTKFSLLINYGSSNKNLMLDMMKSLDEQQKLYEQDKLKNQDFYKPQTTKESPTDSLKIRVNKINK